MARRSPTGPRTNQLASKPSVLDHVAESHYVKKVMAGTYPAMTILSDTLTEDATLQDLLAFQRPLYLNSGALLSWSAVAFIVACHFLSAPL